jgi:hypothetical protein
MDGDKQSQALEKPNHRLRGDIRWRQNISVPIFAIGMVFIFYSHNCFVVCPGWRGGGRPGHSFSSFTSSRILAL